MTADELIQKISKGKIERFYFLHGSEKVYQRQVVQALTQKLITEDNRDFNLDVFNGGKSSVYQWLDSARTIPFMGGTKLIVVENMKETIEIPEDDAHTKQIKVYFQKTNNDGSTEYADQEPDDNGSTEYTDQEPDDDGSTEYREIICQEQDIQALIDYANNPMEGVCLLITADKLDNRKKLLKKLAAGKGSFALEAPKEYTLVPWVINLAKEQGYSMSKDVAETLVSRVGARPGVLAKELEKTLVYVGKKKTVSKQDVSEVVGETKLEDVFSLTKALAEKNVDEALKLLRNQLSHGGDPIQILGAISWQFRMIWEAKSYQAQGIHSGEIPKKMKAHPFTVQKALPYARKFSNQQLRKCYSELVKTDRRLKTSSNKEGAMETLVINLYQAIQN